MSTYHGEELASIIGVVVVLIELESPWCVAFSSCCCGQSWWIGGVEDVLEVF